MYEMKIPRIAIPEINQNVKNYTRAVFAAGMEPVVISMQTEQSEQKYQQEYLDYSEFRVDNYDGLLIPGGWDVNPSRYGQKNSGSIMVMNCLDDLQFSMLDDFVKCKKPVLGISRGHQLINVYFGGSLIQHLSTACRHFYDEKQQDRVHWCTAEPGSWLSELYGTKFPHNSCHHQAVDHPGEGLLIDSRCLEDGTIESMHHSCLPIYGVQWHPERMCLALAREDTVNGLPVLQFFCRICGGDPESCSALGENEIMTDGLGL